MPNDEPAVPQICDLLIQNGRVISMNQRREIYPRGAIAINGRRIVAVGPEREVLPAWRGRRVLDAAGGIVHPGYIDSHVHTTLVNARGAFPDSLGWEGGMAFYDRWWNATEDEDEYASALHAFVEMLGNGTTCVMETGTAIEPDVVAGAMEDAGIRGLVADSWLSDVGELGHGLRRRQFDTKRCLAALGGQLKRNNYCDALVRGHVAIYGMGASSDELMLAAKAAADAGGVTFSQHQSFARGDTAADDKRYGKHPLTHYAEIGALGPNCLFTHMNIIRDDEADAVIASGMGVTWCLTSSMIWGAGGTAHGRHDELYRRGCKMALGSDSGNSALRFDLNQQGVLTVLTARDKRRERTALGPEDALAMLTISGAEAIGLQDQIGSLEVHKRADIVLRSPDTAEAQPALDELQGLVLSQGSKSVDTVLVDGRVVLRKGRHTMLDELQVHARLRESARRMLGRIDMNAPSTWPRVE
jgi:5-methylthioadenosine/S-adenosylhomocysteine deaminase